MNDSTVINKLENLKKLRESKNITQVKLSTDLEVSQELISRYELGSSFPQPNMLIKIANYFNCSVDYLLGIADIPTPVNYLVNANNMKNAEILNKYNCLSDEDKKYFNKFLTFLVENSNTSEEKNIGCIINVGVVNKKLLQHFYFLIKKYSTYLKYLIKCN